MNALNLIKFNVVNVPIFVNKIKIICLNIYKIMKYIMKIKMRSHSIITYN